MFEARAYDMRVYAAIIADVERVVNTNIADEIIITIDELLISPVNNRNKLSNQGIADQRRDISLVLVP